MSIPASLGSRRPTKISEADVALILAVLILGDVLPLVGLVGYFMKCGKGSRVIGGVMIRNMFVIIKLKHSR
jgi:hypothetical protein